MAQKRLIDKSISLSEKLADLPYGAQLLYTWMIPHADDFGLLQTSPRSMKAQIIPMTNIPVEDVTTWLGKFQELGLIKKITYEGKNFFYIVDFEKKQNLREDMQPYTILPVKFGKVYKENWDKCREILSKCLGVKIFVSASSEIATEGKEVKEVTEVIIPAENSGKADKKKERTYTSDPMIDFCREAQGIERPFVNMGKQLVALKKIRDAGYTDENIKFVITDMAEEKHWTENPFDMTTVSNQMHKYMTRTVMYDQKKGGGYHQKR